MTTLALNRRNPSVTMLTIDSTPPPPPPPQQQQQQPPPPPSLRPVNTTTTTSSSSNVSTTTPTTAASSGSLYHICRSVLDKLSLVEGMENYLDCSTTDPLSKLTLICRQGFPLCTLYNALNPVKSLSVDTDPNLNAVNSCKANVYHFIVACRQDLLFPEEDMFTISDLYQNDTNGFVKVVNTINKLLQLLENRGIITVRSTNRNSDPNAPKNTRDKVVFELLETERKYVRDMETLQNYMRELQIQKIVSPDTIHYLFGNLNALVDFQRRFLIRLEEIVEKSPQEQRIGLLFIDMEEAFSVYEPYCANYFSAQDLVVQETPRLQKLADILNPIYQLPSMLIKPVQRVCKYPLLLKEILKSTDQNWTYYQEAQDSVDAIKRVTEKVNETQRQHENTQAVQELKKRLDDPKDAAIDHFGTLMLQDKLLVTTNANDTTERDLHVFFFEKALLICKESKGTNILQKGNTLSINKKKRRGSLVPKIVTHLSHMTDLTTRCKNGVWSLNIDLTQDTLKQMCLKFRNEEQLKLWNSTLTKAIHKATDMETTQLASTSYNEEDEEDEEEHDFYDDEEDEFTSTIISSNSRSRSSSFNQHNHHNHHHHHHHQPMIRNIQQELKYNNGRPHHNVPGMNLSPLPRSSSSLTSNSSVLSTSPPPPPPVMNYNYYPASPPPSHPSSPTSSSRISSTSTSSTTWHRNHEGNALTDIASNFLHGEYSSEDYHQHYIQHAMSSTGRSQSQSAAIDLTRNNITRPALPINQNRLRSQSSPNIMKNNQLIIESLPQVPVRSISSNKPPPLDLTRSEKPTMIRNVASTPRLTDIALSHGTPPSPGTIKIKLNFNDGIYVIVTNNEVTFFELMEKVDKKIRLVANLKVNDLLRLKYQDEDCDFITISSNDDVQMAFESRGVHNTVNLFVSL